MFTAVAHPQVNGQVEVINRALFDGLKKRLEHEKTSWIDELPSVLLAYRTTPRSTTGETLFSLAYGSEAVIAAEIQGQAFKITHFEPEQNEELLRTDSIFLEEKREEARVLYDRYKRKIQEAFNKKVKKREF